MMVINFTSGLTWQQVIDKINELDSYVSSLQAHTRRANLRKRRAEIPEERLVWRLIIQRDYGKFTKTVLRKNVRYEQDNLLTEKVSEQYLQKINNLFLHLEG